MMKVRRIIVIVTITSLALLGTTRRAHAQQPATPDPEPPCSLADLAAQSNLWLPCCEPAGPTKGLWGEDGHGAHCRTWQEYYMSCRDGLSWLFGRPSCSCTELSGCCEPSIWGRITQWLPRSRVQSRGDACGICEPPIVTTGTVTFDD
jgi:hypothetical protein